MFGIGKKITISTVKSGIKNTFVMDYEQLKEFKELFEFGKCKGVQGKIYTLQTLLNKDVQGIVLFSRGKLVQEHSSFDDRANDNLFQYMSGSFDVDFIDSMINELREYMRIYLKLE